MNQLSPWEEALRNRMTEHQAMPPANGWEQLEKALLTRNLPKPFWKRPAFIATLASSAAACLTGFVLLNPHSPVAQHLSTQPAAALQQQAVADAPAAQRVSQTNVPTTASAGLPRAARSIAQSLSTAATAVSASGKPAEQPAPAVGTVHNSPDVLPDSAAAQPQLTAQQSPSKLRRRKAEPDADASAATHTKATQPVAAIRNNCQPARRRSLPTLSLRMGTTPAMYSNLGGYDATGRSYVITELSRVYTDQNNRDLILIMLENMNREVSTRTRHRTPFQVGLGVSFPLNHRWALNTGLTYTRLTTDIESGSSEAFYRTHQHLHYMGIPVQASYTLFKSRPFNAYVTAGTQLEKCIKCERKTTYFIDQSYRSTASDLTDCGNGLWQLSFNLSAGLQANLTRHIGIYFEPGITYYVPDGSVLPTIRHDHPWQFSMQGGLRITLGK